MGYLPAKVRNVSQRFTQPTINDGSAVIWFPPTSGSVIAERIGSLIPKVSFTRLGPGRSTETSHSALPDWLKFRSPSGGAAEGGTLRDDLPTLAKGYEPTRINE